jgi:hypothetical protein
MKVTSLLCKAKHAPNTPDSTIGAPPLELTSKLSKLKQCRSLATEITEKGAEIYELLGHEMDAKVSILSFSQKLDPLQHFNSKTIGNSRSSHFSTF